MTYTTTFVGCPGCGHHRLTEISPRGRSRKPWEQLVEYHCCRQDGGCGARYDSDGNRLPERESV